MQRSQYLKFYELSTVSGGLPEIMLFNLIAGYEQNGKLQARLNYKDLIEDLEAIGVLRNDRRRNQINFYQIIKKLVDKNYIKRVTLTHTSITNRPFVKPIKSLRLDKNGQHIINNSRKTRFFVGDMKRLLEMIKYNLAAFRVYMKFEQVLKLKDFTIGHLIGGGNDWYGYRMLKQRIRRDGYFSLDDNVSIALNGGDKIPQNYPKNYTGLSQQRCQFTDCNYYSLANHAYCESHIEVLRLSRSRDSFTSDVPGRLLAEKISQRRFNDSG